MKYAMKFVLPALLAVAGIPHAQAQGTIWRCEINGRVVYQQAPCAGREVGARDRRTEAQKRAEREAKKREKEREMAAQQAEAASAAAAGASAAPASSTAAASVPAPALAPARAASAPRRKP
jgi:hypothetical protein